MLLVFQGLDVNDFSVGSDFGFVLQDIGFLCFTPGLNRVSISFFNELVWTVKDKINNWFFRRIRSVSRIRTIKNGLETNADW